MVNEFMKSIWLILPITVVTMILEAIAVKHMQSAQKSSLAGTMSSFLIGGLIFGNIAIFAFHKIQIRWPENTAQVYLWIAIAISILISILAVAFRTMVKADRVAVAMWVVMNFLWAVGYGVYLPRILNVVK
jgi:drug/metabolite transporter (DMT)-like permease